MRNINFDISGGSPMHIAMNCANCGAADKSRKRDFSDQAWTVLVLWAEVEKSVVEQPICGSCYSELREVLIDRADEIESAAQDKPVKKSARKAG